MQAAIIGDLPFVDSEAIRNLTIVEASVSDLSLRNGKCDGILVNNNREKIAADKVILTTGTFLGGRIHIGPESWPAGRLMRTDNNDR